VIFIFAQIVPETSHIQYASTRRVLIITKNSIEKKKVAQIKSDGK